MLRKRKIKKMIKQYPELAELQKRYNRRQDWQSQANTIMREYKGYMPEEICEKLRIIHNNLSSSFISYAELVEKLRKEIDPKIIDKFLLLIFK